MAAGINILIPNRGHRMVTGAFGNEVPSIAVLNPNDGVVYLARNRDISDALNTASWDFKLPGQSYGLFPGPWLNVGAYYLDQSGAGTTGELTFYAFPRQVYAPDIRSIGRAQQAYTSSMDVQQGAQPSNPAAGYSRLWVDASGHLNVLQNTGANYTVLDSNNFATYVTHTVGDIIGPMNNTTIQMRNASWASARDSSGNLVNFFSVWSDNSVYFNLPTNGGSFVYRNLGNTVLASLDSTGLLTTTAAVRSQGSAFQFANNAASWSWDGSWIRATGGSGMGTSGSYVWMAGNQNIGMYYDGTYNIIGPHVMSRGNVYFSGSGSVYFTWNGSQLTTNQPLRSNSYVMADNANFYFGNTGSYYTNLSSNVLRFVNLNATFDGYITAGNYIGAVGRCFTNNWDVGMPNNFGGTGGSSGYACVMVQRSIYPSREWADQQGNSNALVTPNIADNRGQILAQSHPTWASVDHARQYKLPVTPVETPVSKVFNITGVRYEHISFGGADGPPKPLMRSDKEGDFESTPTYGFSAKDVYEILPELVGFNPTSGEPEYIDLDRMLVVLWEAFKTYATDTESRLQWLEAHDTPQHPPGRQPVA